MELNSLRWTLHLRSSVAVIELEGEWDHQSDLLLAGVIERLVRSGHLEIIVNVTHVESLSLTEMCWLDDLEKAAGIVRAHRGRLDVVSAKPLVQSAIRTRVGFSFCWAASEEEALCHIFNLPVFTGGPRVTTRLA